jgi:hypothetical protein
MPNQPRPENDAPASIALCIVGGCHNRARGMVADPEHDCYYCPVHVCPNSQRMAEPRTGTHEPDEPADHKGRAIPQVPDA